jgi:2-C-methyl-D-erythritol 2,4-cyclodiphosphate synthase
MKKRLACVMGIEENQINIKATTTEKLGFEGRGEGISSQAVVLLENDN